MGRQERIRRINLVDRMIEETEKQEECLVRTNSTFQQLVETHQRAHLAGLAAAAISTATATLLIMSHPVYLANVVEAGGDIAAAKIDEYVAYFMVNLPALSITGITSLGITGVALTSGIDPRPESPLESSDFRLNEEDERVRNFINAPQCNSATQCSLMPPQAGFILGRIHK